MTKVIIDGVDGVRALLGQVVGTSHAVEVTQQMIDDFCDTVGNEEWIHRDPERCKAAGLGATLAPGLLTQAFFSNLWFEMVDIRNMKTMLFLGSDRVRLVKPLKCGESFNMTVKVDSIDDLDGKGINAKLGVSWNEVSSNQPVTVATFVLRYA